MKTNSELFIIVCTTDNEIVGVYKREERARSLANLLTSQNNKVYKVVREIAR